MNREILPNRRRSELITFEHEGLRFHGSLSRYPDGRIGEVFLDVAKPGGAAGIAARDAAVSASLALQHGASVQTLCRALTRLSDGSASGPLGRLLDLAETADLGRRIERIARESEPPVDDKILLLIELLDDIEHDGGTA